jgi:hypothetical protein
MNSDFNVAEFIEEAMGKERAAVKAEFRLRISFLTLSHQVYG